MLTRHGAAIQSYSATRRKRPRHRRRPTPAMGRARVGAGQGQADTFHAWPDAQEVDGSQEFGTVVRRHGNPVSPSSRVLKGASQRASRRPPQARYRGNDGSRVSKRILTQAPVQQERHSPLCGGSVPYPRSCNRVQSSDPVARCRDRVARGKRFPCFDPPRPDPTSEDTMAQAHESAAR